MTNRRVGTSRRRVTPAGTTDPVLVLATSDERDERVVQDPWAWTWQDLQAGRPLPVGAAR
ncbi:MAG: hypothetical protein ACOYNI_08845 [Acidimicrobiia bacterium]